MPSAGSSLQEIRRIDRSAFSMSEGLRAGAFVSAPLLLGIATGQMEFVYTALGALFLTNSQGPRTGPTPVRLLFVACFIEALAFGLGTLAGTTGWLAIPLTGIGVFLALMLGIYRGWGSVAMLTAINFAVGVGLLGGSVTAAGDRLVFSLLGDSGLLQALSCASSSYPAVRLFAVAPMLHQGVRREAAPSSLSRGSRGCSRTLSSTQLSSGPLPWSGIASGWSWASQGISGLWSR